MAVVNIREVYPGVSLVITFTLAANKEGGGAGGGGGS